MTTHKKSIEIEANFNTLIYYEQYRMENETFSDFIDRIIIEHYQGISRRNARVKVESALGVMLFISLGVLYILNFFKFAENISFWGSIIIGAVGAILYYYKPFKGRVDDNV